MALHNDIGHIGEQRAVELLEKKGYKILERNWRLGHLEVDIIAADKKHIIFVEVKARTSTFAGNPEEAVNLIKRKRLIAAANAYVKYRNEERETRFDIIGILMDKSGAIGQISHYENAFAPDLKTINPSSFSGQWRWKHRK